MEKDIAKSIEIYKEQLKNGNIRQAYVVLTKYIAELKSKFPNEYKTGNISFGYLDFTYFSFFNDYLRERKLRFGIILNHKEMQFELWLMDQNATVQEKYWLLFKESEWNNGMDKMPTYSILELCLESNIDFNNKEEVTAHIIDRAIKRANEIQNFLENS